MESGIFISVLFKAVIQINAIPDDKTVISKLQSQHLAFQNDCKCQISAKSNPSLNEALEK